MGRSWVFFVPSTEGPGCTKCPGPGGGDGKMAQALSEDEFQRMQVPGRLGCAGQGGGKTPPLARGLGPIMGGSPRSAQDRGA